MYMTITCISLTTIVPNTIPDKTPFVKVCLIGAKKDLYVSKAATKQATPGGGSSPREHVPSGVNPVSGALLPVVFRIVAVLAQQFQVVMVQSNARDGDILRREIDPVMDNLPCTDQAAGKAALA